MSRDELRLAPAAIARIGAWPLSSLRGLASAELASQARRCAGQEPGWSAYAEAYTAGVEAERSYLWQRTLEDARFMRALAMSNPVLAQEVARRTPQARRGKRVRHLATTLYRYLARAVGRTEPNGLWVGVALVGFAEERAIARRAVRCEVTPDLSFFRVLVQRLARASDYQATAVFKLNPTLERQSDGGHLYWTQDAQGEWVQRRIAAQTTLESLLTALRSSAPWTLAAAADTASRIPGQRWSSSTALIAKLLQAGVLVGGLRFPCVFAEPWEALSKMEQQLSRVHAGVWRRAIQDLRQQSDALAAVLDRCVPAVVVAAMESAAAVLRELAAGIGVECPELPRAPLRCDLQAPWEISLGRADAARLRSEIVEFTRYQDGESLSEQLLAAVVEQRMRGRRVASLHELCSEPLELTGQAGVLTWERLAQSVGSSSEWNARLVAHAAYLRQPTQEVVVRSAGRNIGEPVASLRFSFGDRQLGNRPILRSIDVEATAAFSRFAYFLETPPGAQSLTTWFREAYLDLAKTTALKPVELAYDSCTPNVLSRPALWPTTLDFWGTSTAACPPGCIALSRDALGSARPAPALWDGERPYAFFAAGAARADPRDFCLHLLLMSSGHNPLILPEGIHLVHELELEEPRHSPRLRLAEGGVIRTRRTILTGQVLSELLESRPAQRFWLWQRLAERHRWSEFVLVHRNDSYPLLVPRDSALAIESAFEGAAGKNHSIKIEEFLADAWVGTEDDDERFHAELVLPFVRGNHTWQPCAGSDGKLAAAERSAATHTIATTG